MRPIDARLSRFFASSCSLPPPPDFVVRERKREYSVNAGEPRSYPVARDQLLSSTPRNATFESCHETSQLRFPLSASRRHFYSYLLFRPLSFFLHTGLDDFNEYQVVSIILLSYLLRQLFSVPLSCNARFSLSSSFFFFKKIKS